MHSVLVRGIYTQHCYTWYKGILQPIFSCTLVCRLVPARWASFTSFPCFVWIYHTNGVMISFSSLTVSPAWPTFLSGMVDGVWWERAESQRNLLGSEIWDLLRTSSISGPKISGLSSSTGPDVYSKTNPSHSASILYLLRDRPNLAERLERSDFERLASFEWS